MPSRGAVFMKNHFMKNSFACALFVLLIKIFELMGDIPPELQNLPYGIYQGDIAYDTARFNYNKRFNVFPQAIFAPTTEQEIAYVLSVLKQYNLEFALRSGGHCYEPASLSSGYIIDLENFNQILPDVTNSQVYLGAGCLFQDIIPELGNLNYAIPAGTCPTNCITGYTLGGGIGLLGRLYGLGCDSVQSITFLNANSEVIEVNANNYPDLFWALRGGGNGSYGIALGFTYKMYYVPTVSYFTLQWNWNPKTFPEIFQAWQKWVKTLPANISTILRLSYGEGQISFLITGLKASSDPFTEWQSAFEKFNPKVTIRQESYLSSSQYWATQSELPFNKGRSKIMMEPLSKKVIKKIVNYFETLSKNKVQFETLFEFEAYGGNIPKYDTAFFPRNAFGWWYQETLWGRQELTAQALEYGRKFYADISPDVSIYSYANTVDYDIGKYFLNAYYGDNAFRLIKVKNEIDPKNLFHWTQSIPLSRTGSRKLNLPVAEV